MRYGCSMLLSFWQPSISTCTATTCEVLQKSSVKDSSSIIMLRVRIVHTPHAYCTLKRHISYNPSSPGCAPRARWWCRQSSFLCRPSTSGHFGMVKVAPFFFSLVSISRPATHFDDQSKTCKLSYARCTRSHGILPYWYAQNCREIAGIPRGDNH